MGTHQYATILTWPVPADGVVSGMMRMDVANELAGAWGQALFPGSVEPAELETEPARM